MTEGLEMKGATAQKSREAAKKGVLAWLKQIGYVKKTDEMILMLEGFSIVFGFESKKLLKILIFLDIIFISSYLWRWTI